ncbi:MAG TPA: hypothetical protein VE756_10610 [Burkholderiales bacterium]|nr:hypothetical protein [Burkholderiales bacterium]
MRKWLLSLCLIFFGAALVVTDVDARRIGGGRSIGAQRSVTPPPAATPAKPAQQQQAAPQQQPSRWGALGGILGGLALGGLLGYLFGWNGLLGLFLLAALAVVIIALLRARTARRAEPARPAQFAGLGSETVAAPPAVAARASPAWQRAVASRCAARQSTGRRRCGAHLRR